MPKVSYQKHQISAALNTSTLSKEQRLTVVVGLPNQITYMNFVGNCPKVVDTLPIDDSLYLNLVCFLLLFKQSVM